MPKFKTVKVSPPRPPVNPDLDRQNQTGSETAKKIGAWQITGNKIQSGSMIFDASLPAVMMKDESGNIAVFLGEDGT